MSRTLILGGGFGGLTVATELRSLLGDDHDVVLVDRRDAFMIGLRKLWALVGLGTLEEGRRSRTTLAGRGIRVVRGDVQTIDPVARRIRTDAEMLDGDYLVVALGAVARADLVPGLVEHGHNLYDADAIPACAEALATFDGGRVAIVVAGAPYKCPPAPYECAMLLDEHLRDRGLRDRSEIHVTTLQPMLLPNAGAEGSSWLGERLAERGIRFEVGRKVDAVEPGRVRYADGASLDADVIMAVPPHRVPTVVSESGLTGPGGWIAVRPATLETEHERVFAIGDVTRIELANGLPLPKAGLFAELQGRRVAAAIAADRLGRAMPGSFDGRGFCFIEMGRSTATRVEGDFFAQPEPEIALGSVSAEHAEAKRRFESERLSRWFGE